MTYCGQCDKPVTEHVTIKVGTDKPLTFCTAADFVTFVRDRWMLGASA